MSLPEYSLVNDRAESRSVLEFTDTRMAEQYMDLYRRLMGKGTE